MPTTAAVDVWRPGLGEQKGRLLGSTGIILSSSPQLDAPALGAPLSKTTTLTVVPTPAVTTHSGVTNGATTAATPVLPEFGVNYGRNYGGGCKKT